MDDTKLLELAGRAAGEQYDAANNPLERDDLALRLAVKLNFTVRCYMGNTCVQSTVPGGPSVMVDDADTRRAITRAAAEIARAADAGGKEGAK